MCNASEDVRSALEAVSPGTLRGLREKIGGVVSEGTLGRILNRKRVGTKSMRLVAAAVGVEYRQRESWERRRALREACRARGFTLEHAAEQWLLLTSGEGG